MNMVNHSLLLVVISLALAACEEQSSEVNGTVSEQVNSSSEVVKGMTWEGEVFSKAPYKSGRFYEEYSKISSTDNYLFVAGQFCDDYVDGRDDEYNSCSIRIRKFTLEGKLIDTIYNKKHDTFVRDFVATADGSLYLASGRYAPNVDGADSTSSITRLDEDGTKIYTSEETISSWPRHAIMQPLADGHILYVGNRETGGVTQAWAGVLDSSGLLVSEGNLGTRKTFNIKSLVEKMPGEFWALGSRSQPFIGYINIDKNVITSTHWRGYGSDLYSWFDGGLLTQNGEMLALGYGNDAKTSDLVTLAPQNSKEEQFSLPLFANIQRDTYYVRTSAILYTSNNTILAPGQDLDDNQEVGGFLFMNRVSEDGFVSNVSRQRFASRGNPNVVQLHELKSGKIAFVAWVNNFDKGNHTALGFLSSDYAIPTLSFPGGKSKPPKQNANVEAAKGDNTTYDFNCSKTCKTSSFNDASDVRVNLSLSINASSYVKASDEAYSRTGDFTDFCSSQGYVEKLFNQNHLCE